MNSCQDVGYLLYHIPFDNLMTNNHYMLQFDWLFVNSVNANSKKDFKNPSCLFLAD